MILPILFAQPSSEDTKVNLDQEKLEDDIPKGLEKVDLDLDDALFLEEEKDEPAPQTLSVLQAEEAEPAPAARPFWKNPKILIAVGVVVVLLTGIGGTMFFLSSSKEPPPPPVTQAEEPPPPEINATQPSEPPPPPPPLFVFSTFQVEYIQGERVRLLTCRFGVPDADQTLAMEMRVKEIILRDGVYRYLKNIPLSFLDDPENSEKLKADIVTVLNQNLQSGQISSILLEEYVVQ